MPDHLREASYALGTRKARTILTVVLPAALPGHRQRLPARRRPRRRRDRPAAVHHRRGEASSTGTCSQRPEHGAVVPDLPATRQRVAPARRNAAGARRSRSSPSRSCSPCVARVVTARYQKRRRMTRHRPRPRRSPMASDADDADRRRGGACRRRCSSCSELEVYYGAFRAVRDVDDRRSASTRSRRSSARRAAARPRCCAASTG